MKCISRAKNGKKNIKKERVKEAKPHNDEYSSHACY
jgi:hypothetical protein